MRNTWNSETARVCIIMRMLEYAKIDDCHQFAVQVAAQRSAATSNKHTRSPSISNIEVPLLETARKVEDIGNADTHGC